MTAGNKSWERWVASVALASSCVTGGLVLGGVPDVTGNAPSEMVSQDQPAPVGAVEAVEAAEGGRVASPYTPGTYQEWRRKYGKAKPKHRPAPTTPKAQPASEADPKVTEAMATLRGETLTTPKKRWRWWTKSGDGKTARHLAELAATPQPARRRSPEAAPDETVAAAIESPDPAETAATADSSTMPHSQVPEVAPAVALVEPAPLAEPAQALEEPAPVAEPAEAMNEPDPPAPAPVEPEVDEPPEVVEATRMVEVKGPSRPVSTTPPSVEMRRRHGSKPNPTAGIQPARYHTTRPADDGAGAATGAATIPDNVAAKYRSPYADWKKTAASQSE